MIVFSIITLGIYTLYWTYQVFGELKEHTGQGGPRGRAGDRHFPQLRQPVPAAVGDRQHARRRGEGEARHANDGARRGTDVSQLHPECLLTQRAVAPAS
ncbi:MAG: DUF4234 domain-containing protein [Acidimicrobiia bacterium]|nr:DUF4234 domain-containing protein [Acidimicrobiia bacterium]